MKTEIATAVIFSLGYIAVELVKKLDFRKPESKVKKAAENNPKISSILEGLANIPEIHKAVLTKVSNSGMKIMAGDSLYGTIVLPNQWKKTFDHQSLDEEFVDKIVKPLLTNRKITVNRSDTSGHLKTMLEVQGVDNLLCYHIVTMAEKMFFIQIDFKTSEVSAETKDKIRIAVNDIKNLMI